MHFECTRWSLAFDIWWRTSSTQLQFNSSASCRIMCKRIWMFQMKRKKLKSSFSRKSQFVQRMCWWKSWNIFDERKTKNQSRFIKNDNNQFTPCIALFSLSRARGMCATKRLASLLWLLMVFWCWWCVEFAFPFSQSDPRQAKNGSRSHTRASLVVTT